jgi:hypothetical protein
MVHLIIFCACHGDRNLQTFSPFPTDISKRTRLKMVCGLGRCVLVEPHPLLLLMTTHPASAFYSHPPPLVSVKSLTIGGIKRRKTHTTHSHSISLFFCTRTKSQAETQMPIARPQPHTNHSETLSSAVWSSMSQIFFVHVAGPFQSTCLLGASFR